MKVIVRFDQEKRAQTKIGLCSIPIKIMALFVLALILEKYDFAVLIFFMSFVIAAVITIFRFIRFGKPIVYIEDNQLFSVALLGVKKRVNLDLFDQVRIDKGKMVFLGFGMHEMVLDNYLLDDCDMQKIKRYLSEKSYVE